MKKFYSNLFLVLLSISTLSYADDYGDFEIDGMSIGDSLLKHYSIDQILNARNYDDYPSDMKFRIIDIYADNRLYDGMQFYHKPNDKNFIIQSLNGRKIYKNINDCYIEKKKLESELSVSFASAEKYEQKKEKHKDDPTGRSTYTITFFTFDSGGRASVSCYDWSKESNNPKTIAVSIQSKLVADWVDSNYGTE